jgi:hypothetical protein
MSASLVNLEQAKAYVDSLLAHIHTLEGIIAEKDKQLSQQGATLHTSVSAQANLTNAAANALQRLTVGHGHRAITSGHRSAHSGPREIKCKNGTDCNGYFEKNGQTVFCVCEKGQALKAAQPAQ